MSNTIITDLSDFILNKSQELTFADILVQRRTEYYEQRKIEKEEFKNEIKDKCNEYFLSELYNKIFNSPLLDIFTVKLDYTDKNKKYLLNSQELIDIVKDNIKPVPDFNIIEVSEYQGIFDKHLYCVNITVKCSKELLQRLAEIPV